MSAKQNVDVLLEIFAAIERRDAQRVSELCEADVEFSWPPPLPYAGVSRGLGAQRPAGQTRGSRCSPRRQNRRWIRALWRRPTKKS
jgi:ketosteroid isomerase-like protein